jgi:UDP-3-O-[3-hydroxymyristoyl] glucosamine N-acyltransferase
MIKALNSAATIILINKKVDVPEGKALLISEDPFNDFNNLTKFQSLCGFNTSILLQQLWGKEL